MADENSKLSNLQVVGGQMNIKLLNKTVEARDYAIGKAYVWLSMINENKRPRKWNKPTKQGTKVRFDIVREVEVRDLAFKELELYLNEVNLTYGTDIALVIEQAGKEGTA